MSDVLDVLVVVVGLSRGDVGLDDVLLVAHEFSASHGEIFPKLSQLRGDGVLEAQKNGRCGQSDGMAVLVGGNFHLTGIDDGLHL